MLHPLRVLSSYSNDTVRCVVFVRYIDSRFPIIPISLPSNFANIRLSSHSLKSYSYPLNSHQQCITPPLSSYSPSSQARPSPFLIPVLDQLPRLKYRVYLNSASLACPMRARHGRTSLWQTVQNTAMAARGVQPLGKGLALALARRQVRRRHRQDQEARVQSLAMRRILIAMTRVAMVSRFKYFSNPKRMELMEYSPIA